MRDRVVGVSNSECGLDMDAVYRVDGVALMDGDILINIGPMAMTLLIQRFYKVYR